MRFRSTLSIVFGLIQLLLNWGRRFPMGFMQHCTGLCDAPDHFIIHSLNAYSFVLDAVLLPFVFRSGPSHLLSSKSRQRMPSGGTQPSGSSLCSSLSCKNERRTRSRSRCPYKALMEPTCTYVQTYVQNLQKIGAERVEPRLSQAHACVVTPADAGRCN